MSFRIISVGKSLPTKHVFNKEISSNPEWIENTLGIKSRRICEFGQDIIYLATNAAEKALEGSKRVDAIIVATSTPDKKIPSIACHVKKNLRLTGVAFDINAACSGFVYALNLAQAMTKSRMYKSVLVIGADTYSKITNPNDRDCVFFGDGAGAFLLEADPLSFFESEIYGESTGSSINYFKTDFIKDGNKFKEVYSMKGSLINNMAKRTLIPSIHDFMEKYSLTFDRIDCIVPHQANLTFLKGLAKELNVDISKFLMSMEYYGNTASASIPITTALNRSKIRNGDLVLFITIGAGMTWGIAVHKMEVWI